MMAERPAPGGEGTSMDAAIKRRGTQVAFVTLLQIATLFGAAGTLRWRQAWAYVAVVLGAIARIATVLLRENPELVAERGRAGEGVKGWDRVLAPLVSFVGPLALLLAAGLEKRLRRPAAKAGAVQALALALVGLSYGLVGWAMAANKFFAGFVRVQTERGHLVASTGPYRHVRHPGYTGMVGYTLATPLALGSRWAFVPALLTTAAFVLRTALEDRTLHKELPGYADYARHVRYRLLPGIW